MKPPVSFTHCIEKNTERVLAVDDLLLRLDEIQERVGTGVAGHIDRVERLLMSIARNAPTLEVATLAMNALSAASAVKRKGNAADALDEALSRLRTALLEARKKP